LSIEVTLLLKSNSEEIERISFVQHYKRKVVKNKEEATSPFVMKKYETELKQYYSRKRKIRGAQSKDICDCKGTVYPEYEEQGGEPKGL
jgi:hypothetical protein